MPAPTPFFEKEPRPDRDALRRVLGPAWAPYERLLLAVRALRAGQRAP